MKPFRFRLESVLKHQARKLDSAQFERAAALKNMSNLAIELAGLRESRLQCATSPSAQSRLTAWNVQQASLRVERYRKQEAGTEQALKQASGALQERERHLRIARRELKKYELLKDRRLRDWQKQERQSEQKQLDEVASRQRRSAQFACESGKVGPTGFETAL